MRLKSNREQLVEMVWPKKPVDLQLGGAVHKVQA